ncbi:hypothetical protein [Spirosoma agri]|uniref:Uncharacterized protein n=1 Tax=Spirosoma agri TaxID=1987381 RepID=A0A6M0IRB3_9BACT|nr:hypothetical protein [Spirosoma agri]NEU70848.1 hypothetical protein [Spirosoma agri]
MATYDQCMEAQISCGQPRVVANSSSRRFPVDGANAGPIIFSVFQVTFVADMPD